MKWTQINGLLWQFSCLLSLLCFHSTGDNAGSSVGSSAGGVASVVVGVDLLYPAAGSALISTSTLSSLLHSHHCLWCCSYSRVPINQICNFECWLLPVTPSGQWLTNWTHTLATACDHQVAPCNLWVRTRLSRSSQVRSYYFFWEAGSNIFLNHMCASSLLLFCLLDDYTKSFTNSEYCSTHYLVSFPLGPFRRT